MYNARIKATNMIFNGSAQVMQQEVQVISRVKLFLPSFYLDNIFLGQITQVAYNYYLQAWRENKGILLFRIISIIRYSSSSQRPGA